MHFSIADTIAARCFSFPERVAIEVLDELNQHASFAFLVPSMLSMVAEEWERRGKPRVYRAQHIISAGAPLAISLTRQAMEMFPNARIAEMYGWTEGSFASYEVKRAETLLPHSVGWPALGADIRLFREDGEPSATGEVGVKSGVDFSGYLGKPELTAAAWHRGYLMSGDIGIFATDGRLCIVDRKKDMIISGGENVYTAEVERILLEHPAVLEAAVVGLEDARWGERVAAMLVLRQPESGEKLDTTEIETFCRGFLAGYKVPRQFEFVDELPRNAMGKVRKNRVVESMGN